MNEWEIDRLMGDRLCKEIIPELEKRFNCKIKQTIQGGEADRELSADLIVEFLDRTEVWAVKFRREHMKEFGDVTVEYENGTGKRGDWFRFKGGIVQKYVYGFSNGEMSYSVIDVKKMMSIPDDKWKEQQNKKHGSSKFKTITFKELIKRKALIRENENDRTKNLPGMA